MKYIIKQLKRKLYKYFFLDLYLLDIRIAKLTRESKNLRRRYKELYGKDYEK